MNNTVIYSLKRLFYFKGMEIPIIFYKINFEIFRHFTGRTLADEQNHNGSAD